MFTFGVGLGGGCRLRGAFAQKHTQLVDIRRQTTCVLRILGDKFALSARAGLGKDYLGAEVALPRDARKAEVRCANLVGDSELEKEKKKEFARRQSEQSITADANTKTHR